MPNFHFISGLPRSGSTLLAGLFQSYHRDVNGKGIFFGTNRGLTARIPLLA